MSFDNLGLSPALLCALNEQGYTNPTPIQSEAIPLVLAGRDLLAGAQTGTGKTAAFALPLLERLYPKGALRTDQPRKIRALVLTPTRELAVQVHESIRAYGKNIRFASCTIFGGVGMGGQVQSLRRGMDIVVATPGRLIDHLDQRTLNLRDVEILVLDEADRMLDMGFLPAIKKILGQLPRQRQNLMFSATYAEDIRKLATEMLNDPAQIQIAQQNSVATGVEHRVYAVDNDRKKDVLVELLAQDSRRQTLVFGRTKHGSDRLARQLVQAGFKADAIHGNKSQNARQRALKDFKDGRITVLVATDIAARGLDIDQLPVVINYDLPMVAADYVHRIGRTGRAGHDGLALSLVSRDEQALLNEIQRLLKRDIEIAVLPGFEPKIPLRTGADAQRAAKPGRGARRPHAAQPNVGGKHHAGKDQRRGGGAGAGAGTGQGRRAGGGRSAGGAGGGGRSAGGANGGGGSARGPRSPR
ncbi:ATP-dependent RNA helicase RhlE [Tahibacter aquaticus]|uniref:DEAD-box ATP-dependent RNA helicase RhpA n=1 Tax=Tahibacter aquaticus TaxID=520092 RepID=A0A4R6YY52_9GAMM|nr:DEAD/DEAH box helicase [Tahibacter aquaticus]TDR43927.1 ATP-dependent RNA helicase RhlE [Tahibacter aquaticus]